MTSGPHAADCRGRWPRPAFRRPTSPRIGITNQRETTVVWDRATGQADPPRHRLAGPAHRRRLRRAEAGRRRGAGHATHRPASRPLFLRHQDRLDPRPRARRAGAGRGRRARRSARSTASCIWQLTGGNVHVTDATNASRTLLFNIHTGGWDDDTAAAAARARARCCRRCATAPTMFGTTDAGLFGVPYPDPRRGGRPAGGDRRPGLLSARHDEVDLRHGLLRAAQHRRPRPVASKNRLLTTHRLPAEGHAQTYALEGSIFIAGAAVQWLRDGLGHHRAAPGQLGPRRRRRTPSRRSISCRPSPAWARPIGIRSAGGRSSA